LSTLNLIKIYNWRYLTPEGVNMDEINTLLQGIKPVKEKKTTQTDFQE
jgi:hypothetical protein